LLKKQLMATVDEDTQAFNGIMLAFQLPKSNDEEKAARKNAIQLATKKAIEVPLKVMTLGLASMEITYEMALKGNPNSVSDAGVGALCARTAVAGAYLNVRINAAGFDDKEFLANVMQKAASIDEAAEKYERETIALVEKVIAGN
jgi:glutamate formiminotransferase/formiminotetrahydrofolate cyclodeaminase